VHGHARTDRFEQARNKVDLHRDRLELVGKLEQTFVESLENAMITRSMS